MGVWRLLSVFILCASLLACGSPWLKPGETTQAEVQARFGPPHFTWTRESAMTVWEYRFDMGLHGSSSQRADCTEYRFLFDQNKVLLSWDRRQCLK